MKSDSEKPETGARFDLIAAMKLTAAGRVLQEHPLLRTNRPRWTSNCDRRPDMRRSGGKVPQPGRKTAPDRKTTR